jgi:hypothetical protein
VTATQTQPTATNTMPPATITPAPTNTNTPEVMDTP